METDLRKPGLPGPEFEVRRRFRGEIGVPMSAESCQSLLYGSKAGNVLDRDRKQRPAAASGRRGLLLKSTAELDELYDVPGLMRPRGKGKPADPLRELSASGSAVRLFQLPSLIVQITRPWKHPFPL